MLTLISEEWRETRKIRYSIKIAIGINNIKGPKCLLNISFYRHLLQRQAERLGVFSQDVIGRLLQPTSPHMNKMELCTWGVNLFTVFNFHISLLRSF